MNNGLKKIAAIMIVSATLFTLIYSASQAQVLRSLPRKHVEIRPRIPSADRSSQDRIFIEHADQLTKTERDSFMVLIGDVHFTKGPMNMYCDSAHYFAESESLNAYGNVRMEQGDTLFVYADELNYDGITELAVLYADYGKNVRLINRDVELQTTIFNYDLSYEVGYYEVGGVLTDKQNRLVSDYGEYLPSTKDANFYGAVNLTSLRKNDTLDIVTDTLCYNTDSHIARLYSPSTIVNKSAIVYTRDGLYDTQLDTALLLDRSLIVTTPRGSTLTADTLYYDRTTGFGEAFGNMILTDSVRQSTLKGDYGFFNELTDSAFVTGHALAMEYSKGDTLYLHAARIYSFRVIDSIPDPYFVPAIPIAQTDSLGAIANDSIAHNTPIIANDSIAHKTPVITSDSIDAVGQNISEGDVIPDNETATDTPSIGDEEYGRESSIPHEPVHPMVADTTHIMIATPRVRFYRSDMQGLCDSLRFEQRDSTLFMHRHPIVWSDDRQIFGNVIQLHLNDSTIERATLPDYGFIAQHIEEDCYDQLSGKEIIAYFYDDELKHLDVKGNVEAIMFPEENDSTINKVISLESSTLAADFAKQAIQRLKTWPETSGTVTPLYLAKRSILFLPKFKWYGELRPKDKDDIFVIPAEMDALMNEENTGPDNRKPGKQTQR